jgi:hypothetical protein
MIKNKRMWFSAGLAAAAMLSACGGGGDGGSSSGGLKPTLNIAIFGTSSMAGKPKTTAMLKSLSPISEAVADGQGDAAAAALQDALTAAGVPTEVKVGVMDSTTLHDYVVTNYGTTLPTAAQIAASPNPTTWVVSNFTMADLKGFTQLDPTAQQAALDQFSYDLNAFIKWQHVAGNWVVILDTDPSIDPDVNWALTHQILPLTYAGTQSGASFWPMNGFVTNVPNWQSMMSGPDGNTPNDDLKALKTQEIVRQAVILNGFLNPTTAPAQPASGASAAAPASAASA